MKNAIDFEVRKKIKISWTKYGAEKPKAIIISRKKLIKYLKELDQELFGVAFGDLDKISAVYGIPLLIKEEIVII